MYITLIYAPKFLTSPRRLGKPQYSQLLEHRMSYCSLGVVTASYYKHHRSKGTVSILSGTSYWCYRNEGSPVNWRRTGDLGSDLFVGTTPPRPGERLSWLRFSRFSLVPPGKVGIIGCLKSGHGHFLPNPLQSVVHWPSYHSTLYNILSYWQCH
jgi:hypothetical protein